MSKIALLLGFIITTLSLSIPAWIYYYMCKKKRENNIEDLTRNECDITFFKVWIGAIFLYNSIVIIITGLEQLQQKVQQLQSPHSSP